MARGYRTSLTSLADLVEDPGRVARWLYRAPAGLFLAYVGASAFVLVGGSVVLRDAFLAVVTPGAASLPGWPAPSSTAALTIAQVAGLVLSKALGVKLVSEVAPTWRARVLALSALLALIGLLGFALVPAPFRAGPLLLNGLALGAWWGLVFGFLEGRRWSDGLGAVAATAPVISAALVPHLVRAILGWGTNPAWAPLVAALLVAPALGGALWMLAQVPPPSRHDEAERLHRAPMTAAMRWQLLRAAPVELVMLLSAVTLLGAYRSLRAGVAPAVLGDRLVLADIGSVLLVALLLGALVVVRDNVRAVSLVHWLVLSGAGIIGAGTALYEVGAIEPWVFLLFVTLGYHLAYVPFGCALFDRMIPAIGHIATAGFLICLTDVGAELGALTTLIVRAVLAAPEVELALFGWASMVVSVAIVALLAGARVASRGLGRGMVARRGI